MQRLRIWVRNVFGFSRSEANGFLILLPAMLLILFSYPIYRAFFYHAEISDQAEQARIDSLIAQWEFNPSPGPEPSQYTLFPFDPNTATRTAFDALGMPDFLSDRIVKYRSKGGRFRAPGDLLKIYGLDSALFQRLYPFIRIAPHTASPTGPKATRKKDARTPPPIILQDLNQADTSQLKTIRGIGPVLARRIVKFRDGLGGFIDQNQVTEIYGLDSVVIDRIKSRFYVAPQFKPLRLNINTATETELSNHPYIRSKIAKSIVAYRFQHGSFERIDDLLKIDLIDQTLFDRIKPYLSIGQ